MLGSLEVIWQEKNRECVSSHRTKRQEVMITSL